MHTESGTVSPTWIQPIADSHRTAVVLASLAFVAAAAHVALRWWLRRAKRQAARVGTASPHDPAAPPLIRGLTLCLPPLVLMLWMSGVYIAAIVLLRQRPGTPPAWWPAIDWAYRLGMVGGTCWLLSRVGVLVEILLQSISRRTTAEWDDLLLPLAGRAARRVLPLLALILGAPLLSLSPGVAEIVQNGTSLLLIVALALILFQIVDASALFVLRQHRLDVADNLRARSIHTQVVVLKKVALTIIGIFTLASMLMVFDSVRQFGASILASAGLAGIVIGFAAQRSIATLLAGFQIALTQPIRVDDVVIVENEWGRVEDITLTYVVVRVWDLRRLIVPINYFIEQPFQNWTRASSELLATVFVHLDYTIPVDALRSELTRILTSSAKWDGKVNVLQVTDAKERTLEIRALASATDASLAWDLRCEIREQLIAFVQRHYPDSLPRMRGSLASQ